MRNQLKRLPLFILLGSLAITIVTLGLLFLLRSRFNALPQLIASQTASTKKVAFPEVDTASLSSTQQKVIAILKQEYAQQPAGTKYSEGVEEPWCADFVSWVFKQAGVPLTNPNTGYWHIPGTYTLREYYESHNRFKLVNSGYAPKVGDIMLYDNPSPFGQHTNIVIKNNNGIITTIGGNEPGGIRIVTHKPEEPDGFIGFGVL
jgi:hypothetical protein